MNTHASLSVTDLLVQRADPGTQRREWQRQARALLWPLLAVAALLVAWTAAAPLAGAVVAPARIKTEFNRKTVQHQQGGIVREILVRDGQQVKAGEALLVLADTRNEADLSLLQDRWQAARARMARIEAEVRLAPRFDPPADLRDDRAAAAHLARERHSFTVRRQALDEQTALLQAQAGQSRAQAEALESQIESTSASARLSDEELALNTRLADEGYVQRTRLIGLQRVSADYRSRLGEHRGDLAAARQRASEVGSRIALLRQQYHAQAAEEGKQAAAALREIEEQLRPSRDQVERQVLRSPVDGQVMQLRVAAAGTVVGPREPLLDVLPLRERLVVDGRVSPQDIEHVRVGGTARVRLLGAGAQTMPAWPAKVSFVSPDRVTDPSTGASWFEVTVEVDPDAIKQPAAHVLQAGMPAELYVTTAERTLLQYLLKPLNLFSDRALREP